jgi:hypothetical protein
MAENRQGTGAGTVVLFRTAAKNEFHQVEILAHRLSVFPRLESWGSLPPSTTAGTLLSTAEICFTIIGS